MVLLWSLCCAILSKDIVKADFLVIIADYVLTKLLREIILLQNGILFDVLLQRVTLFFLFKVWVFSLLLRSFFSGLILFFFLLSQFEQLIQVLKRWYPRLLFRLERVLWISRWIWVNIIKAHGLNSTMEVDYALLKFEYPFVGAHDFVEIIMFSPWQDRVAHGKTDSDPAILWEIDGEEWVFHLWFIIVIILFLFLLLSLFLFFASHNILIFKFKK